MRIDAHQHFWQLQRGDYAWMQPDMGILYRDYLPSDLAPLLDAQAIQATVVVQAAETVAETHYLLHLADEYDWIKGVVGWVDMTAPDVTAQLQALAQHPKFVGIRPMLEGIADPAWLLLPELDQAYQALIALDLRFDALVHPQHLPHLSTLLQRYPTLRCVIDHAAKPAIHAQQWADWAEPMQRLAQETTVCCKLSGLSREAGADWQVADLKPYVDFLHHHFGANRLLFGSDWPVLRLTADYAAWVQAVEALTSAWTAAEQDALWGGTALRFYGLHD